MKDAPKEDTALLGTASSCSRGGRLSVSPEDVAGSRAQIFDSIINMTVNVAGASFVTMAFCLKQVGLQVGLALMLVTCCLNAASAVMIAECCEAADSFDFYDLGKRAFGEAFGRLVRATMVIYTLGSCIALTVVVGDFLTPKDFAGLSPLGGRFWVMTLASSVVLVLALQPNLSSLSWSSGLGLVAIVYTMGLVVARERIDGVAEDVQFWAPSWTSLYEVIPVFSVAFTAHYNMPRYYSEMGEFRSPRTFSKIIAFSFSAVCLCSSITAACGYLIFGGRIQGNLLMNLGTDHWAAFLARVSFGVAVIASYALVLHSLRSSIENSLGLDVRLRFPLTAGLVSLCLAVAANMSHVEVVVGYKGAIPGTLIVYIFPGLMYWKLKAPSQVWPFALVVHGFLVLCFGTLATTRKLFKG